MKRAALWLTSWSRTAGWCALSTVSLLSPPPFRLLIQFALAGAALQAGAVVDEFPMIAYKITITSRPR